MNPLGTFKYAISGLAVWLAGTLAWQHLNARERVRSEVQRAVREVRLQNGDGGVLSESERRGLHAQLRAEQPESRWAAAQTLGVWRDRASVGALLAALRDEDGTRRTCLMAQALGDVGDPSAVPELVWATSHPTNVDLRMCARHALAEIGDEQALPPLIEQARGAAEEQDRCAAIAAIGELGFAAAEPALRVIARTDTGAAVRARALDALWQINLLRGDAVPRLLDALEHPQHFVQDDWILRQLIHRWDERCAAGLNRLAVRPDTWWATRVQVCALLLDRQTLQPMTLAALDDSGNRTERYLAAELRSAAVPAPQPPRRPALKLVAAKLMTFFTPDYSLHRRARAIAMLTAAALVFDATVHALAAESASPERKPNRLIHEKSPYLLQHAYNPVDWYPWGEEAFAKARRENKPIFLSVGYSTCHWCHVMERESFENPVIARLMNEHFVSIKVDREERPDIDKVYMTFVQATTGGGGWPMTVMLTPELRPFFGGTYFPPEDKWGRPGLKTLLNKIADAWKSDRAGIEANASEVVAALQQYTAPETNAGAPGPELFDAAFRQIAGSFDPTNGGFGGAPKFPRPVTLNFLFQVYAREPDSAQGKRALEMARFTLRKMADGGIHDHIGGGFHRYTVDGVWHVPHFEKMLYDQAQLATAYLTAYQITHESFFADVARDILDYVHRDMTDRDGGFYSAEDADSAIVADQPERGEGAFYVWTREEIVRVLGAARAKIFAFRYGVEAGGNAPSDPQGEFGGKNVLIVRHTVAETAKEFGLGEAAATRILAESRNALFDVRAKRPRPHRDDKIITAWNGLMISAFARAAQILGEPRYLETAQRAADFLQRAMYCGSDHRLHRSFRQGVSTAEWFADDYAYLVQGLLDLYETSFDVRWLEWAQQLQVAQDALFWDATGGGYFGTTGRDATVLLRTKEDYDGAEPSPNSISVQNLMRFALLLDEAPAREKAEKTFTAFSGQLARAPSALPQMLAAADWLWGAPKQIVIAGRPDAADTRALVAELHRHFVPRKVVVLADGDGGQQFFARQVPFFHDLAVSGGAATAFVCENYVCQLPTTSVEKFAELLAARKPLTRKPDK